MPGTEQFQLQTADALRDANKSCPEQVLGQGGDQQSRRFNIYRNNRTVSLIENLQACYPAIFKLVGTEFFNAAARHYINEQPPKSPVMAEYGESFGEFISQLPSTSSIPYIADVAAIEWARLQAYHQIDAEPLAIQALATIAPEKLTDVKLTTHPTLALIRSRWAVGSIWAATINQQATPEDFSINNGENVLVVRPGLDTNVNFLEGATAQFLSGLIQGQCIGQAAECALEHDAEFNPGSELQLLFSMGSFVSYS